MPCLLLEGNARIDSNPDTMHAWGVLSVSTTEFTHKPQQEQVDFEPRSFDPMSFVTHDTE